MAGRAPDTPLARLDDNRFDSPWACVASVTTPAGIFSAVCAAERFVLTAAHVASTAASMNVYLNFGADLSHRFDVVQVVRHPGYTHFDPALPAHDLALLELSAALPEALRLPVLMKAPLRMGQRIEIVGHGASGQGDGRMTAMPNPALRRVGANRIDRLSPQTGRALVYGFTFDDAGSASEGAAKSLGNAIETGLAGGDSGSPAFTREASGLVLAGINSFFGRSPTASDPHGFGAIGGGQILSEQREWLRGVIGEGGLLR